MSDETPAVILGPGDDTLISVREALHASAKRILGDEANEELLGILDTYAFRGFTAMAEGDMDGYEAIPDQILALFESRRIAVHKEKWGLIAAAAHGVFSLAIRLALR